MDVRTKIIVQYYPSKTEVAHMNTYIVAPMNTSIDNNEDILHFVKARKQ